MAYLCGGGVVGGGSRRGRLGRVGALGGQRPAALGLTETLAVFFTDLQSNKRSGQWHTYVHFHTHIDTHTHLDTETHTHKWKSPNLC